MKSNVYFYLSITFGIVSLCVLGTSPEGAQSYFWIAGGLWGLLYLLTVTKTGGGLAFSKCALLGVLLLHISAFLSGPILEDDYYRYSWDGRNMRMGVHPYSITPYEQVSGKLDEDVRDDGFKDLSVEKELKNFPLYTKKINYPMYRTVYPPLTEFFFLSESLVPGTVWGWPIFLFLVNLALGYYLIFKSKFSFHTSMLILANPLYVKEGLNSWHFDMLLVPILLLWLTENKNKDAFYIGLMAGIRPWFLALSLWKFKEWRVKDYTVLIVTLAIPWICLFLIPGFPEGGFSSWSSFVKDWELNPIFYEFIRQALNFIIEDEGVLRGVSWMLGFIAIGLIWLFVTYNKGLEVLAVVTWLLFLPTVNPWYIMPASVLLVASEKDKFKALGVSLCVCMPLAYKHYAHLDYENYLHWSWSLLVLGLGLASYFTSMKWMASKRNNV